MVKADDYVDVSVRRIGFYDFASAFIVRQYGPCPDPVDDPDGEERWHARLGLVAHAIGEFSRQRPAGKSYTPPEIESLAWKFADGNDATADPTAPDAIKLRMYLGMFIAWLAHQSAESNLLHFEAREEG